MRKAALLAAALFCSCALKRGQPKEKTVREPAPPEARPAPPQVRDFSQKAAKGKTPEPSPEVEKWMEQYAAKAAAEAPDFAPLLESLADRDYDAAHAWLHPDLRKAWTRDVFAKQVAEVRDCVGDDWSPRRVGYMKSPTPQGMVHSVGYRLTKDWQSPHAFEFVAQKAADGHVILQWTMSIPNDMEEASVTKLRGKAVEFLRCIQDEEYESATSMMAEPLKGQVNPFLLAQIRSAFWKGPESTLEFTDESFRKLINGVWYVSVVAYPTHLAASYMELILLEGQPGPQIASFNLKAKVSR